MTGQPTSAPAWHTCSVGAALAALRASPDGLTAAEARARLATHGPNALAAGRRRTLLRILTGQLTDFMVLVLMAAAAVSALLGDVMDTIGIVAIVILDAVVGSCRSTAPSARWRRSAPWPHRRRPCSATARRA